MGSAAPASMQSAAPASSISPANSATATSSATPSMATSPATTNTPSTSAAQPNSMWTNQPQSQVVSEIEQIFQALGGGGLGGFSL